MKHTNCSVILLALCSLVGAGISAADEPYQPSWDSLSKNMLPEWVKDAKFGAYTHWGVYSVPAHGGPDYVRNLYEGSPKDVKGVFSYHTKKYGPPEKFGYKDLIPMFTAPKFNAEGPTVTRGLKRNNKGEEKEQWDWRKKFTASDIRFTTKGDTLYAIALAWPKDGKLNVRSLANDTNACIVSVGLLGHQGTLTWSQTTDGLEVSLPAKQPCDYAYALRITTK